MNVGIIIQLAGIVIMIGVATICIVIELGNINKTLKEIRYKGEKRNNG